MERERIMEIASRYWLSDDAARNYFEVIMSRITHDKRHVMRDPEFAVAFVAGLVYAKIRSGETIDYSDLSVINQHLENIILSLAITPYIGTPSTGGVFN